MLLKLPFQVEGNEGVWLAELAEELTVHFSLQLVGYTQGMQGCAVALTSLPLGWLADRPWMGRSSLCMTSILQQWTFPCLPCRCHSLHSDGCAVAARDYTPALPHHRQQVSRFVLRVHSLGLCAGSRASGGIIAGRLSAHW